jgi:hypothetical protein
MRTILTKDVMATMPLLVAQGMKSVQIAEQLGVKIGTLKVRCSQEKISLRRPGIPRPVRQPGLKLKRDIILQLRVRADVEGMTEMELATSLLNIIVTDNLFDAVLDHYQQQKEAA